MSFSFSLVALLLLITLPLVILWRLTLPPEQNARRLRRSHGWSQQRIADRLGVTRYRVRVALGVA